MKSPSHVEFITDILREGSDSDVFFHARQHHDSERLGNDSETNQGFSGLFHVQCCVYSSSISSSKTSLLKKVCAI